MDAKNENNACFGPSGDDATDFNKGLEIKNENPEQVLFYTNVTRVQPEIKTRYLEEIVCKLLSASAYVLISVLICMLAVKLQFYIKSSPTESQKVQEWNLNQLTEQLQQQVVGQQEAIATISGEISETYSRPIDKEWLKVIFLIGGPSVGKGLVIDTIDNHLQNNKFSTATGDISDIINKRQNFCSQIIKDDASKIDFMFLKNYNICESLKESEDTPNERNGDKLSTMIQSLEKCIVLKNKKAILFVSSEVVTENEASEFNDREEYDSVLESTRQSLVNYTVKHSLHYKVTTVIFRPLAASEVVRCLLMQGLNEKQLKNATAAVSTWHNYRKGFVSQGCRPLDLPQN